MSTHRICCCGGMSFYAALFGDTDDDYTVVKYMAGSLSGGVDTRTLTTGTSVHITGAFGVAVDKYGQVWCGRGELSPTNVVATGTYLVDRDWSLVSGRNMGTASPDYLYNSLAYNMAVDDDANVYIANSVSTGTTSNVVACASYDYSGSLRWETEIDTGDTFVSFRPVYYSGSVYLTSKNTANTEHIHKLSASDGSVSWSKSGGFGTGTSNHAGLAVDSSGNAYVCGTTSTYNTVKVNSSGTNQWGKVVGPSGTKFHAAAYPSGGNLWVGGENNSDSKNLYEVNPSTGSTISSYQIDGGETIWSMEPDPDGNLYVGTDNTVLVVDASDGSVSDSVSLGSSVLRVYQLARCGEADDFIDTP